MFNLAEAEEGAAGTHRGRNGSGGPGVHRIALIGSGPRGLSVLERLAARLAADPPKTPVEIYLIDAVQIGCGRIWRTDQPEWFLMNTVAGEVSAFSGLPDDGPARPGAGPSLGEWWATQDPDCPGENGYAPRGLHGRYMLFVLESIRRSLPARVRLHEVLGRVQDIEPGPDPSGSQPGHRFRLRFTDGEVLDADRVVLVTGHTRPELTGPTRELADFAAKRSGLRYIRCDSTADMPLDDIPAGSPVGIIGLGLSFYDVMAALTLGRGGRFEPGQGDGLVYRPSGREPILIGGSRSGVPLPARGKNQKHHTHRYTPVLFTVDRLQAMQAGPVRLDFGSDVVPWLLAEVQLVYNATAIRHRHGRDAAERFVAEVADAARSADGTATLSTMSATSDAKSVPDVCAIATRYGMADLPVLDLDRLARPFEGRRFAGPAEYQAELSEVILTDLAHAEEGNVDSPLKAALDVIRDTRAIIRLLVDYAALSPLSYQRDFLGWYVPRSAFLAVGPPRVRLRQLLALVDCGVLRLAGPWTSFTADPVTGRFIVGSPQVAGSGAPVDTLIDARVPVPSLPLDPDPLTLRLRALGLLTEFVNGTGDDAFPTGGVAITRAPYHPIGGDGRPVTGMYVLGIPTEHTRWFMQAGSSRPAFWTDFVRDADAIAADALAPVAGRSEDKAPNGADLQVGADGVPTGA